MPLFKDHRFVDDPWITLGLEGGEPGNGAIIVPLARFENDVQMRTLEPSRIGVALENTVHIEKITALFAHVGLLSLAFPVFADGRAYSLAAQIREAGFKGELRATGNVLPDQVQFMQEVGFDAFVVDDRFPQEAWIAASHQMSLTYQRGLYRRAGEREIWSERHLAGEQ